MNAIKAKAILKVAGIITLAVVFGFSVFSCSTEDDSSSGTSSLGFPGNASNSFNVDFDFVDTRLQAIELWTAAMNFINNTTTSGIKGADRALYIEKFDVGKAADKTYSNYPSAQTTKTLNFEANFKDVEPTNIPNLIINGSSKISFVSPAVLYTGTPLTAIEYVPEDKDKMTVESTVKRTYTMGKKVGSGVNGVSFTYGGNTYTIYGAIVIDSSETKTGTIAERDNEAPAPSGRWTYTEKGKDTVAIAITVVKDDPSYSYGAKFSFRAAQSDSGKAPRQVYGKGEEIYSYIDVRQATGSKIEYTLDKEDAGLFSNISALSKIAMQFEHLNTFYGILDY